MRIFPLIKNRRKVGATLSNASSRLWNFMEASYVGGFRISKDVHGYNANSTASFSRGAFTLSEDGNSIFIGGSAAEAQVGEFAIPEIVNTRDSSLMNIGGIVQDFAIFIDPEGRFDPGFTEKLRHTGMLATGGKLIVNYYDWYDGDGSETNTTAIFDDAQNIDTCNIVGPFQMDGAARGSGWVSPIPAEWQTRLGATHVSGWAQGSINSRLSVGPSAYFWNPASALSATVGGAISTEAGATFPVDKILHDKTVYPSYDGSLPQTDAILFNDDLNNDLWTFISGAAYGFIIPGTDTYMTVGHSGGHNAGIGYHVDLPGGGTSDGHAPLDGLDYNYGFYWLWDVNHLEAAKNGSINAFDVRPYEYGPFETIPYTSWDIQVVSGCFDPVTGRLYLSLYLGDEAPTYARPPLFLVYQIISV